MFFVNGLKVRGFAPYESLHIIVLASLRDCRRFAPRIVPRKGEAVHLKVSRPAAVRNSVANIASGLSSLRCGIVVASLLGSCREKVKQFTFSQALTN